MISFVDENFKKNLKKNIYGKAHITKIIFPPGSGAAALHEAKAILNDLWAAKKFTGEVHLLKNEIQVRPVYMLAITELLLRNHCFSDVRLVIFKEIVIGKKAFDKKSREIRWDYYLNKKMLLKIKVNSVASTAFHETGLKKILTEIIKPHVSDVVSGEGSDETTCLYVEFYKNKLTISISLAGQPLYKRGYRGKLSASAPLKEDAAACCIQTALLFAKKQDKNFLANTVLVPFSGTGTFAFEYCQIYFQLISAFFEREYALKEMPLFRKTHFDLLVNKAKEQSQTNTENIDIICIDKASNAVAALEENIKNFTNATKKINSILPNIMNIKNDFFKMNLDELSGNIFIPLNPPYGIRLNHGSHATIAFYKKIAEKINTLSLTTQKNKHAILGFILCPTQETWSAFTRNLQSSKMETYHFTQGGLDIRVCQFFISGVNKLVPYNRN